MAAKALDLIATSDLLPFFSVANADDVAINAPANRLGDSLRTWARCLAGFQKEALVRSSHTGRTWRFVCDEGPCLNGHDRAPCPLAFLSTGMAASFMNEILALAKLRGISIGKLKLTQDNYYTVHGSLSKRTMLGGAENIDLHVEIDCDLDDQQLNEFLIDATYASPLNGLMRGRLESLFKLSNNSQEISTGKSVELEGTIFPDPGDHFAKSQPFTPDLELVGSFGRHDTDQGSGQGNVGEWIILS